MSENNNINNNLPWWAPFAKAVWGALIAFISAFLVALLPYLQDGKPVSVLGWVTAVIAGLATLGVTGAVVYRVPNRS